MPTFREVYSQFELQCLTYVEPGLMLTWVNDFVAQTLPTWVQVQPRLGQSFSQRYIIVVDSSSSEIGTTMKNNNKFANLFQSINFNSSSPQLNSLTSIAATKTHTAHLQ